MFLRSFYSIVLIMFINTSLRAQDVVIYSKKSEEVVKALQELVKNLDDKTILNSFKLSSVKAETDASTDLTGKSFEVDESLKAKSQEVADRIGNTFKEDAKALKKEEMKKGVEDLKVKAIEDLSKELDNLKASGLAPLNEAIKKLTAELSSNQEKTKKLDASEAKDLDKIVAVLLKTLKEANEEAVISSKGEPVTEIKKAADDMTHKQSEEKFPFPVKANVEAEAVKKYPKFKVGQKVSITYYPTPNRPQKASGVIRSIDKQKIKVNFSTVNIDDIKDPIVRDGMRPLVTDKNRKDYVDSIYADIRKKRLKYYNQNLQANAESIIAENEKKGFILAAGKWQPSANYTNSLLGKRLAGWKTQKLDLLEKAELADKSTIEALEANRNGYNAPAVEVLENFKKEIKGNADQIIAEAAITNDSGNFSEEDFEKFEKQKQEEERKKKEEADKAAAAKKKEQLAINKKKQLVEEAETEPEESGSGQMVMIGIVLLVVGGIAFVFFNPKLRSKFIPGNGKKKSMEDVVANLDLPPGAEGQLPMPGGPMPPPGSAAPPGGSMAPTAGMPAMGAPAAERTKIDLDGDVNIVRGENVDEAPSAAPRKKISLNLGSSTPSLSDTPAPTAGGAPATQNSVDPASAGGLTPPGGGLTPPGGGLTPPGGGLKPPGGGLTPPGGGLKPPGGGLTPPGGAQGSGSDDAGDDAGNEDKSNLILNPNLDGSGTKLRLKK